jgi:putative CocE/NonD family hydrolase
MREHGDRVRAGMRRALAAAVAAIGCLLAPGAAGAQEPAPFAQRVAGYVTAPDGVALRYAALLPRARGQFPVIIDYSGYASGSMGAPEVPLGGVDARLLEAGYAVVGLNMRGSACSEGGPFVTFDPRWGTDGRAAVEWAAHQPWSDGRVGMAGWSLNGVSQLWTASTRPPSLRAVAPGMVIADLNRDAFWPGGIRNDPFAFGWWSFVIKPTWQQAAAAAAREGDARCAETVARNLAQGEATSPPALQAQHPYIDAFLSDHTLLGRTERIDVPLLSMEAWQDEATGVRGGHYQRSLDPRRTWYVGTNGAHNMYTSDYFVHRTLIPFLDAFVKGERSGFAREPKMQLWEDAVGSTADPRSAVPTRVLRHPRYPAPTRPYFFPLRPERSHATSSAYRYPVRGPGVNDAVFGGAWDRLDPDWQAGSVAFTGPAIDRPMTLWGSASADLWVSTTARDTDLQVTVTDVRPDGQEQYLQRGWLRLSERKVDERQSTLTLPVQRATAEATSPVTPGLPVLARLEVRTFMHTFRPGSRIRIWVDAPSTTGQFGFGIVPDPATNRIWHDRAHPSRVVFSRLDGTGGRSERARCGEVLLAPCRPDPLR